MRPRAFSIIALIALCITPGCRNLQYELNQDKARLALKSIRTAQTQYKSGKGEGEYGSLEELAAAGLIDPSLASGIKDGYRFRIKVKGTTYEAFAVPVKYGWQEGGTGSWSFYLDESGVIRGNVNNGAEANANDPPVRNQ